MLARRIGSTILTFFTTSSHRISVFTPRIQVFVYPGFILDQVTRWCGLAAIFLFLSVNRSLVCQRYFPGAACARQTLIKEILLTNLTTKYSPTGKNLWQGFWTPSLMAELPRMIMIAFFFLFVLLFAWRCACQLFFRGRGSTVHVGSDDNEEKWEWCSWMEPLSSTPARPFLAIVWQTTIKILNVILYVRPILCPQRKSSHI